jgi:hypothetical protein
MAYTHVSICTYLIYSSPAFLLIIKRKMADPAANAEREFCDALMPLCFNAEQQNA